MEQSSSLKPQLDSPLAHELINKLSIVIGGCDLLVEQTPEDSPFRKQINTIRNTAKAMATDLAAFECEVISFRMTKSNQGFRGLQELYRR
jgi:hypothetical protein